MKPFTVIFYIDGDKGVGTFTEKVMAANASEAWDVAVKQAKDEEHYLIRSYEFEHATEIVTFDGHIEPSKDYGR
jgi:hypothetical protein